MTNQRRMYMFAASCLVAAMFMPLSRAAEVPDSEQVTKLLADVKSDAYLLRDDAQLMESYTRSDISLETQKRTVELVKSHVNAMGKTLAELVAAKDTASPWQVAAIDRIQPFLRELADNTTQAINYINGGPKNYKTGEYKDYIEANADVAAGLFSLISDFVDYGNHKNRMQRLAIKLEVSNK